MDVKGAVRLAKSHVTDLFEEENVLNVGLEEVEQEAESGEWLVTVGFSRPWDKPQNSIAALTAQTQLRRTFKTVRISDIDERVVSVKNREAAS